MGAVTRGVFQRIGVNPPRLIMIFRAKRGMTTAGGEGEIIPPLNARASTRSHGSTGKE